MKALLGLTLAEIQEIVNQHGLPKFTAKQLTKWLYKKHTGSFDEMTNLSKATRQLLSENYTTGYRNYETVQESKEGTKKYLFPGADNFIESAYIPDKERATLCVSSQVGCKMNCLFCQTGKQGWQGDLTTRDILNQIYTVDLLAAQEEMTPLSNIVYMGQGEPLDNSLTLEEKFAIAVHSILKRYKEQAR